VGEDLMLQCRADPPLPDVTITWYKDGKQMQYATEERLYSLKDGEIWGGDDYPELPNLCLRI